jgi:NAD(P)-dependent dehydrogenase (short-subunit alcohol dehydrogenase family)
LGLGKKNRMSKTWLITGASSGLGQLMSERLLSRGDRVIATVRREGALDDLLQEHGDRLAVAILDLTDKAGIRAVVDDAFARMGRIDVVVSNAGYGLFGAAEELTDAQIDQQIATNLTGSIQFIRAALPYLRRQGSGRPLGSISSLSSPDRPARISAPAWSAQRRQRLMRIRPPVHCDEPSPTEVLQSRATRNALPMQTFLPRMK